MTTIAVYSLKGGVGKTSIAVNLSWLSATRSARRTLIWDLDPQAATTFLLGGAAPRKVDMHSLFTKERAAEDVIRPTPFARLELLGADSSLRRLDDFFTALDKKKRLARLIETFKSRYDRILLDCPAGLTATSEQVIRAADLIVIPVIPSPLSQRALAQVVDHLHSVHKGGPPVLSVFNLVDRRRAVHRAALEDNPDWPVVPMASAVELTSTHGKPVGAAAPGSVAAQALQSLWIAVERKIADNRPPAALVA